MVELERVFPEWEKERVLTFPSSGMKAWKLFD